MDCFFQIEDEYFWIKRSFKEKSDAELFSVARFTKHNNNKYKIEILIHFKPNSRINFLWNFLEDELNKFKSNEEIYSESLNQYALEHC